MASTTWCRGEEHEEALVLPIGRANRQVQTGVHGKLPYPFETVEVLPVRLTQQMTFGYKDQDGKVVLVREEALMITVDENVVWADLLVEWKIADFKKYRFNSQNPQAVLRNATSASLRSVIGALTLDCAITAGKLEIQMLVQEKLKERMGNYDLGVSGETVKYLPLLPRTEAP